MALTSSMEDYLEAVSLSQKGNVDRIMGYEKEKQTEKGHAQER